MKVIRKTLSSMSGISGLLAVAAFVLTLVAPVRAQEREYSTIAQAQPAKAVSKSAPKAIISRDQTEIGKSINDNILIRIDGRAVQAMKRAWSSAGAGVGSEEAVLLIFRMPDDSIQASLQGITNERRAFTFKWHPSAVAIVHTHPNSVDPQPSRPDRQLANKLGVPIFTLTVRGMYLYDPHTRKVTQIKRGLDWLELSKWKLMTLATRLATFDAGNVRQDSFAATVDSAFERVETILKSNSEGARFFGPYTLKALTAVKGTIQIASGSDLYTGIRQVYGPESTVVGEVNSDGVFVCRYRVPSRTIIYKSGPFFPGGKGGIGSYPPGSPQAQTLALLHELAHNIAREGGGYLIPDDDASAVDGPIKGHHSTAMIERLLRDQIWRGY